MPTIEGGLVRAYHSAARRRVRAGALNESAPTDQQRPAWAGRPKVCGPSVEEAWGQIATFFGNDPVTSEGARLTLANAILSAAGDERRDVGSLKRAGIQAMVKEYKSLSTYSSPATGQ